MTPAFLWRAFLLLVVLSPLPLGSNRPLVWSLLGFAVGLLLLGWAWLLQSGQLRLFWRPALWPPLLLMAAVLLWIVLQTGIVPLSGTNPLWDMTASAVGKTVTPAIGLAPDAARSGLLKLLTYVGVFWLALQLGRDSDRAWQLVRWLAWASAAYAAYGLINYFAGNSWLLWYERWAYAADVTSTFVSRNHYATFAALGMLAATTLSVQAYQRKWRLGDRSLPRINRSVDALIGGALVYLIIALVVAMAWLQTHSRMGFAAGTVGVILFLALLRVTRTIRSRWLVPAMLLILPLFLISVSGNGTIARLDATQDFDRAPVFALVAEGIKGAPWVGYGYGSFPSAFQLFRDTSIPFGVEYAEAHSTYLELAFELGIPAAVAAVAAVAWMAALCLRGVIARRRDALLPALGFASSAVVGLHSIVDFSAQIPALAVTLAGLIAVGAAQSWSISANRSCPRATGKQPKLIHPGKSHVQATQSTW